MPNIKPIKPMLPIKSILLINPILPIKHILIRYPETETCKSS